MSVKPHYCSRCGTAVALEDLEGRERAVCPACRTVFYENPLPVAASIVLNPQREVLLVKRRNDPYKGQWCLPMGFAEIEETISAAALRELKEEAGINARVIRLVDADSFDSERYGELLIVTFEMRKTDGEEESAGDDAEELRYFPIASLPYLPFNSNMKALRTCTAQYHDRWAIQDSFVQLQSDEDRAMLSDALVEMVESQADDLVRRWMEDVRTNPTTKSYHSIDTHRLHTRVVASITQFSHWLCGNTSSDEVRSFYESLAARRGEQGVQMPDLISALMLLKKHIWSLARSRGVWERPLDVYRVLELNRRTAVFFDKAVYHVACGFHSQDTDQT